MKIYGASLLIFFFLFPAFSVAEVIFSDDFNAVTDGWNCLNPTPAGWTGQSACEGPNVYDGQTHYAYEISSGGRSGNSLKIWTHGNFPNDRTFSVLDYSFAVNTYRELYTRWYMKIPSDFDTTGALNYLKFWRYNHGTDTTYFNWEAGTTISADGLFQVAPSAYDAWHTVLNHADIPRDGQWHCHELRIKLNSTGNTDGILQYWLDGVLKTNETNVNYHAVDTDYFKNTGVGIGNRGETTGFQTPWRAVEFDDFVVSTTYIGPAKDATPPSPPHGVKIVE